MLSEDLVAGGWHKFPTVILLNMHSVRCFPSPSHNTSVDSMYSWFGVIATFVWNICSCTINTHIHVLHYTILYMYTMCTYVYHIYWTCRYVIHIHFHKVVYQKNHLGSHSTPFSGLQVFPSKNGTFVVALGGGSHDVAFVLAHSFSIMVALFYLLPFAGSKIKIMDWNGWEKMSKASSIVFKNPLWWLMYHTFTFDMRSEHVTEMPGGDSFTNQICGALQCGLFHHVSRISTNSTEMMFAGVA